MDIQDLVEVGMERRGEGAGRRWTCLRRLRRCGAGRRRRLLGEKLEPRVNLRVSLRREQLLALGMVAERRFFETGRKLPA